MGFFQRFWRVVRAWANKLLSKMEEPEAIVEQAIQDLQESIKDASQKVGSTIAYEKRLKKMLDEELEQSQIWEKRAEQAVLKGRDDLAKEALARKAEHDKLAEEYRRQWEAQKIEVEKLKESLKKLRLKLEEAKRKKTMLLAKKRRAEAKKMIQETMSTMIDNSALETIDRMMNKVEEIEAQAEAQAELNLEYEDMSLEKKFKDLDIDEGAQDEALLALKAKMGLLPSQRETEKNEGDKPQESLKSADEKEEQLERELERIRAKVSVEKEQ